MAREYHPDIVILDILMPGMDGWAVLSELKAAPGMADVPIILLTMLENKEMGFALGAADYLTKPIRLDELLARARPVVAGREWRGRGNPLRGHDPSLGVRRARKPAKPDQRPDV